MPIFNVPGRGSVQLPDGYTKEEYERVLQSMQAEKEYKPEYSGVAAALSPIVRGTQNLLAGYRYDLPALGLSYLAKTGVPALEQLEYPARELLQRGSEEYARIARERPRSYETFEDVKGPIDAVGYGLERFGEFIPQLGTYLTGAGIGGAGARMLARKASKDFSEELLSKGVAPGLLSKETADAAIAGRLANIAAAGQAGSQAATSGLAFTQIAPETFRNVYEETGKLEPGISSLYGGIGMLIERIVPDRIKDTLGNFGKVKIAENAAKLSGRMEAAKILAKEAAIVSQLEGLTEAAQGVISNAAAKYVDNNIDLFSDKRIRDYLEQYFSGAMGGGGAGLISKVPEALSAKRQIEKAQAAPPKEVAPPELTSPTPPEGPITPRGAIALIEPPSATPTVTTSGGLENLATMGGGLVDAMYDQIFKAYQRGTTQIAGNKEYILEVAKEQGRAFQSPDDIKAFVQEPGVGDRVQQLAQEDRVRRLAKAGKTPDEIKKMVPQGIDVDTILGIQKSGMSVSVPPPETIQLAETPVEEGPPEFVEPPIQEGPPPKPQEIIDLESEADRIRTDMERVEKQERKQRALGKTFLNALKAAGVSQADIQNIRQTQSDKNLDRAAVSGLLDPWLKPDLVSTAIDLPTRADTQFKQNEAVEYLKDRILTFDYVTEATKLELQELNMSLNDTLQMIKEYYNELSANLEAAQVADEQRAIYEQVEPPITEGEERTPKPSEGARPEAPPSEVTYTPSSYAEQLMSGTLPDTDEANAYFEANRDAIEQALNDLEERRAEPMMRGSAAQKKNAQEHADDLGGLVVYLDGDLSLIRGHSRLTGQPVYIAAKGDYRAKTDIEAYTGNLVNAKEKAKLVAAKNAIEVKEADKHAKSPFITFDSQGVAVSQSVSPQLKGVLAGWKKLLKITPNIYVTTISDIEANLDKFTGPHRVIGSAALGDEYGSVRKMADGEYYIAFTDGMSMSRMLETLAHELGHMHMRETFDNADVATQKAIRDEFDKWLKSNKGKSAMEQIQSMRARGIGKLEKISEKHKAEDLSPYWSSFKEWYADQVSRWATTSEKPLNVVERFFKRLADAMRSFYTKLRNQKYLPNETFKQYMDKVTANIDYVGPVRVAAKPLGKLDQMALFMRTATSQFDTPEFKRWFGDSKVVGPDGKPLIMYHGTSRSIDGQAFTYFDLNNANYGLFGYGGYFTDDPNMADEYTRKGRGDTPTIYPVYLSIKNPLDMDATADARKWNSINIDPVMKMSELKDYHDGGKTNESWYRALESYYKENNYSKEEAAYEIQNTLIEMGYDGITHIGGGRVKKNGARHRVYIAFEPTQIKSVYNVGTFDPSDTEISYMRRAADEFTDAGKDMSPEDREKLLRDVDDLDVTPKKGMEAIDSMIKNTPSFNSVKEKLGTYINDASTNNADNLLAFLNMRQLAELAKKILPQIGQYYRVITTMIDAREKQQTDAAKIYQRWEDWAAKHPALSQALDRVMMDARMSGIDPTIKADKIKKESFLANWNKIKGTEGEEIFIEVRDFWKKQLELKFAILEKKIEAMQTDQTERQKTIAELRSEYEKFISDGPYFPLTRFGDYFVAYNIKMPDGSKKPYHEMFESQADQRRHLESIEKDIASGKIIDIKSGVDTKEMISKGVVQSQFLNKIFKAVDNMDQGDLYKDTKQRVKDDIYQAYLSMMPDLSVHKHFIHAKKVAGASFDFRRGFAETAFHNINHLSRLQYGYTLDQIVAEAARVAKASNSNAAGRYLRELDKLHGQFSNPQKQNPIWSKISNFSFLFYLTAPASAIVNMTQTPIIGMPTMAGKFNVSYAKVGSEIVKASKEFFASRKGMEFNLSKYLRDQGKNAEANALDKLESTLNRTQTLSLAGVAERPSFMYTKGIREAMRSKGLSRLEKVNIGLGYMFNQAEIYNRYVTALVSIRLANEANSKLEVPRFNVEETARDLVNQIHFEYSSETKPRFMRGPLGQVALQFKNYSQQITYLLASSFNKAYFSNAEIEDLRLRSLDKGLSESERANAKREYEEAVDLRKEARTRFTGIMGMTALFAGYEGLPMYWAVEGIMNMFFGDDDEPYDFSLEMKVALANLFGDNVSRMLSRGPMSEILQIDLAGRTSLNNIWFRDDATAKDEEEWVKNMLIDLMGPAAGIVVNTGDAIKKINEGHYWRGTEAMMPPILKDFFKAARFSTEGATTLRGDPIVPNIGPYGIFMQAMGFTPTDVARGYEAMGEIKGIEKKIEQRRSRLLGKLWLAHQSGDYEAYSDIGEDIIKFNAANPNEPIDDKTIKNSFAQRSRVMERAERGIVVSPKRQYLLEKTSYLEEE